MPGTIWLSDGEARRLYAGAWQRLGLDEGLEDRSDDETLRCGHGKLS